MHRYYDRTELSYRVILGGTKHFGWYESGQSPWRLRRAVLQMESVLAQKLALPPGSRVLDAGSGLGNVARRMASKGDLNIIGVDARESSITKAIQLSKALHLENRTRFMKSDYHKMDLPDIFFDGLYTMETLVHSYDVASALAEFCRVTKPGGRLVMFEYSRTPPSEVSAEANRVLSAVCGEAGMPALLRLEHGRLEAMMADVGLEPCETIDATEHMLPMLHVFSRIGQVPYSIFKHFGTPMRWVNAMTAVEMYRHQEAWRYNIYSANKGTRP